MRGGTYEQGASTEVALRDFAPDLDPTSAGILLDLENAVPTIKGFAAGHSAVQFGSPVPLVGPGDEVIGAIVAYFSDGTSCLYVGTRTHLWLYTLPIVTGPTIVDGGGLLVAPPDRWHFFQFGDDVIAVARNNPVQVAHGVNATFGPLGGGPAATNGDAALGISVAGIAFLFGNFGGGVQWFSSAAGVDNDWIPDVQTLAASGLLTDYPGPVTAAAPFYRTAIVFKEQAIWSGSFVGPPFSWSFQLISDLTGTRGQESVVVLPDSIAFLGTDDFYLTTGTVPIRIPNSLKEWFFANADPLNLQRVQGWYDPEMSIITWHFVSTNTPIPGVMDLYVSYNVRAKRWAKGRRLMTIVPQPPVSPVQLAPLYFDETNTPQGLSGPPGAMILFTGWTGMPGQLTQLMRIRAKYNVYPGTQNLVSWSTNILSNVPPFPPLTIPTLGFDDWFNLRVTSRYHQVSLATSGPAEVMAFAYEGRLAGIR